MLYQLLREWPPGYGGIERVAHEISTALNSPIYSLDVSSRKSFEDPLSVSYDRIYVPACRLFGRLYLPLPSKSLFTLLFSSHPLHCHLPSPAVLLIALFSRLIHPGRVITLHWHCFLESSSTISSFFYSLYQYLAIRSLFFFNGVITTSPILRDELVRANVSPSLISVLPCCLSLEQENFLLSYPLAPSDHRCLKILFIGRLDSYKRIDYLISSLSRLSCEWSLDVLGDGPKKQTFINYSEQNLGSMCSQVVFVGLVSEETKNHYLLTSDVLVLPSDRCNEAFGIVQLEAMAAGSPSLAFSLHRSGMSWVSSIPCLSWSRTSSGLSSVLEKLCIDRNLLTTANIESRDRYINTFSRSIWLSSLKRIFKS